MMVKQIFIGLCFAGLIMIFMLGSDFDLQVSSVTSQLFTDIDFGNFIGSIVAILLFFIGRITGSLDLQCLSFIFSVFLFYLTNK